MHLLGIDLGGSFIKSAVLDTRLRELRDIQRRPFPEFLAEAVPGAREIDPRGVLATVRAILEESLSRHPSIEGLVFSTQMHSVLLCSPSGQPLTACATWQDQRSLFNGGWNEIQNLRTAEISWSLGNELKPGHPCAVLHSWKKTIPAATWNGAMPLSLADWIVHQLSGNVLALHPTQAAATGLWSVRQSGWHHEWISPLGLGALRFPETSLQPQATSATIGGRTLRILPPIGDQQAALLGVGLKFGDLSVNVATGSQVSQILDRIPEAPSAEYQLRPFFNGMLLATITHLPAGRSLNPWVRTLGQLAIDSGISEEDVWSRLIQAAETVSEENPPRMDLSLFPCATGTQGSVTSLTETNLSAAQLFRAALRSMAENYRNASRKLPSRDSSRILASGGLGQKIGVLRSDLEKLLHLPVVASEISEDSLNGLLIYASAGFTPSNTSNSST